LFARASAFSCARLTDSLPDDHAHGTGAAVGERALDGLRIGVPDLDVVADDAGVEAAPA
jgi:hypothetical protein